MVKDMVIVTIEGEYETASKLSNGTSLNDLRWPFYVTIIQRQITWKWYNIQLYLQWLTNRKSNIIYQTAPFSMTLNDPTPSFKVTPFFDAEYLITVQLTDIVLMNE